MTSLRPGLGSIGTRSKICGGRPLEVRGYFAPTEGVLCRIFPRFFPRGLGTAADFLASASLEGVRRRRVRDACVLTALLAVCTTLASARTRRRCQGQNKPLLLRAGSGE